MTIQLVDAGELMARRNGSIDPSKFSDEEFELHSIPAFDAGRPELLMGSQIGSSKQIVQPGDVMISKIVPHIRRSSVVGTASGNRQIASGEWIVFRSSRVFPHYLRHYLVSDEFHAKFMSTVSGVGGSLLRARPAEVAKIRVPLPPLPEQRRIATMLDKADALRVKRREAIAKLDQLLQSVFFDMFGDPVKNPKGWPDEMVLGDVADIVSGITKGRRTTEVLRSVPYLAVANVQDRYLKLNAVKSIDATESEIAKYRLVANDLLLTEGGDPDKLGRGALWDGSIADCIHQNHVFRVRVASDDVSPMFLNWLVGSARGKKYFLRSAKQTTGIASINMSQLRKFPLLVPPAGLQKKFARFVSEVEVARRKLVEASNSTDCFFRSLQQMGFTGKL